MTVGPDMRFTKVQTDLTDAISPQNLQGKEWTQQRRVKIGSRSAFSKGAFAQRVCRRTWSTPPPGENITKIICQDYFHVSLGGDYGKLT